MAALAPHPREVFLQATLPGSLLPYTQAAALLVKLMGDLKTEQPMAVLTRALGMLEQAMSAKAKGQRLGVYDPATGRFVDMVI